MSDTTDPTRASALAIAPDLDGTTVAVTGANGFVGARTCTLLAAAGADVHAVVRRPGTAPVGGSVREVLAELDEDALRAAFDGCDVVVHTAAVAGPDLATARTVNVGGTTAVLAAARAAGVGRVVHVSTTSVYAAATETPTEVDEDAPLVGEDAGPYAVTKREAEDVVAGAGDDGPATVVLRPPAVLGWGPTSTWGQRVPDRVRDGELGMDLDPRGTVGWVHVDDLAAAIALAASDPAAAGRTYVVAAGDTDWGTYLGAVHSWYPDAPSPFTAADEPPAPRRLVTDRIRRELGWVPTVDLDTALGEIAAHHAGA